MEFITTLVAFVIAISILVTVHEFGHFWVARRLGVKVLRFSIGFGSPLWSRIGQDGVEYVVAAIPLGGYVKMLDEREGDVDPSERHLAFNRQGKSVRAAIVVAGPVLNFLFAILAYWLVFTVGETGMRPVVGQVEPSTVAAEAGFLSGDEIVKVGDQDTASWEQALYALMAAAVDGDDIPVRVKRKGEGEESLLLSGDSLAALIKNDDGVFEKLGLKPMRLPAVIGELVPGEAAEKAGLKVGDRVVSVNEKSLASWGDWVEMIRANPGAEMRLLVVRADGTLPINMKVGEVMKDGAPQGRIGAGVQIEDDYFERMSSTVRYEPWVALGMSIKKTGKLSLLTLKVMWRMVTGNASVHNLSGPITIAQTAGKTAEYGFIQFVKFLALVSVSLGVLNLLPIPILDGGHLLYILVEAIRGRPLSDEILEGVQKVGLALLLSLMLLAFYVDIIRLSN
jgi:regulator of sigma E protease